MKNILLVFLLTLLCSPAWANVPSATPLQNNYTCNSSTTQFPYAFPISATIDMTVYLTNTSTGVVTQIASNLFSVDTTNVWVNYPLVGSPCATGNTLTLLPSTPQTQITTYSNRTPFQATAVGASFDKLTMISQQLQQQLNRALLAPVSASTALTLPAPVNGYVLGWQSGALTNFVPNSNTYITTSTDGTMGGGSSSDSLIPTQKAVNTYVNAQLGAGYATAGANSNITSLSGLLTPLSIGQGGTGSSASANAANGTVILNGSGQLPALSGLLLTAIPLVNQTAVPYVKVTNTKTSGTAGGTALSGAWRDVLLNTKDTDTGSIASIVNTNEVSLPAGTYQVRVSAPFYKTGHTQIRLYNTTDSSLIITGESIYTDPSVTVSENVILNDKFTISGTKSIALQYQCGATEATDGQGVPASFDSEVYAQIEFFKIA